MEHGCALKRVAVTGLLALFVFAPSGLSRAGELGLGGEAMAQADYAQDGYAEDGFAIDQFYDELAPFGEWVDHPGHGYVWLPRTIAPDWRPYTVGNWIYTDDYGWYWDSDEPFAWAVYHYGRWGYDPEYGWYWVPGDTWAPAWVQWRYCDEYVGWAPEAPAPSGAYAYGGPAAYAPPPPQAGWVFVQPRYLTAPAVHTYAVPQTVISIAFSRSTYVYRPEYRNGYVYNYGMPRDRWSRITRQHIEPRKVHRGHSRSRPKGWNAQRSRDLYVYAPAVKKGAAPRTPPRTVVHKPSKATAARTGPYRRANAANEGARPRVYGPGGGKPHQVGRPPSKPQAGKPPAAGPKADKPNDAKAGPPRGRPHGPMAVGAPGSGKPHQVGRPPSKPQAGKPPAAKPNAARPKANKPKDAKAGAPRGRPHGPMAVGSPGSGKPPQIGRPASKPQAGKPPAAKPNAARPNAARPKAGKPKDAKAGAPRGRPHGPMAVGSPGSGKPPQIGRPASKSQAVKPPTAKSNAAKAKADKAKAHKAKAHKAKAHKAKAGKPNDSKVGTPRGRPHGPMAVSAPGGGKTGQVKRAPSKQNAAKAKPPQAKPAKAKENSGKSPNGKSANGKGAKAGASVSQKSAKAAPGPGPDRGSASGGGKRAGPGKGGGDRTAACKAKPDLPFCGRRGG